MMPILRLVGSTSTRMNSASIHFGLVSAAKVPAAVWLLDELQTRFSNWIESRPEWHDGGEGIQVRVTPT